MLFIDSTIDLFIFERISFKEACNNQRCVAFSRSRPIRFEFLFFKNKTNPTLTHLKVRTFGILGRLLLGRESYFAVSSSPASFPFFFDLRVCLARRRRPPPTPRRLVFENFILQKVNTPIQRPNSTPCLFTLIDFSRSRWIGPVGYQFIYSLDLSFFSFGIFFFIIVGNHLNRFIQRKAGPVCRSGCPRQGRRGAGRRRSHSHPCTKV